MKWYREREGLLDISESAQLDYLPGGHRAAVGGSIVTGRLPAVAH
jgi:hypothetical protein